MSTKQIRYPELSRFMRNFLESREWSVRQCAMIFWPMTEHRLYDILEGRRTFDGWEVAMIHKKTGVYIPYQFLRGEDRWGRQRKEQSKQLQFEALRIKK